MRQRGFSLVELMIVVAIMGVLASIGLPAFMTMIDSNRSKSAAESITSGLRLARSEAIARNAPVRFQLVSSLDATCALSSTSVFWVVTQTNQGTSGFTYGVPAGKCDNAATVPPDGFTAPACDATHCDGHAFIIYKSPGNTFRNTQIAATSTDPLVTASVVTFGPLGQVLPNLEGSASLANVAVSVPTNADAKAWQVRVSSGSGAVKFCDPALAAGSPLACT